MTSSGATVGRGRVMKPYRAVCLPHGIDLANVVKLVTGDSHWCDDDTDHRQAPVERHLLSNRPGIHFLRLDRPANAGQQIAARPFRFYDKHLQPGPHE